MIGPLRIAPLGCLLGLFLTACQPAPPQALGTLEWDRITVPAPAAEVIVSVDVQEGQQVSAGTRLLQLQATRSQAQLDAAQALAQQSGQQLAELKAGPREEKIAQARAGLVAAQAQAAQAALAELQRGSRAEQIAAGEFALGAAQAQAAAQAVTLDKLSVVAPRAGRIDSLPYKLGDQAPVGAPLVILLVGATPHARIYVPETLRANVHIGDNVQVQVAGRAQALAGAVRTIRSEASFTPYYALTGKDAARLSYLAEVSLGSDAADLPAGLPVTVEFAVGTKAEAKK